MPEIYFQPSIIIFAGTESNKLYNELCSSGQLERIYAPLRNGIGVMCHETTESGSIYSCRLLKDEEKLVKRFASAEDGDAIKDAIDYVYGSLSTSAAQEKGFVIVTTIPTIYVIGSPEARHVVSELRERGIWNDIRCLFIYEPDDHEQKNKQVTDASSSDIPVPVRVENTIPSTKEWSVWAREKQVTFCYFYGDVSRKVYQTWQKPAFQYAAIDALFALITTGITNHPQFRKLEETKSDVPFQHGTLSTCFVSVPRREIRTACHAKVSALLLHNWFKHIETGATEQEFGTEIEAEKHMEKVRGLVKCAKDFPQRSNQPTGFASLRGVINGKKPSSLPVLPWMPIVAYQENVYQGEQEYQELRKQVEQHTKAIFQHVAQEDLDDPEWVANVQKRYQEMLGRGEKVNDSKKQWLSTVETLWIKLQEVAIRNLQIEIAGQLVKHGLLWTIAYCKHLQLKLDELGGQIGGEPSALTSQIGDETQQEKSLPQMQATEISEEKLRSDIEEQIYMTPSFRLFAAMALVAALTLALPLWLFASTFTGKSLLLLFLLFLLCLILIAISCWWYRRNEYIAPRKKKQQDLLDRYYKQLVSDCEDEERTRRKALIEALKNVLSYRTQVISVVEPVVNGLVEDFDFEAKKPIEQLFNVIGERGQRTCYLIGGTYLRNKDQAFQMLGITLKNVQPFSSAFSAIKTPVARIYENVVGKNNINLIEPGGIFVNAEAYLQGALDDYKGSSEELSKVLRQLLEAAARSPLVKEKGTYLSSDDFKFDVNDQSLWETMLQSLSSPPLCQFQQGGYPQAVFLCASRGSGYVASAKKHLAETDVNLEDIEMHSSIGKEEKPFSDNSPWILLAGLYISPLSLQVTLESVGEREATQQLATSSEAKPSTNVVCETTPPPVVEDETSPALVVKSEITPEALIEGEKEMR